MNTTKLTNEIELAVKALAKLIREHALTSEHYELDVRDATHDALDDACNAPSLD